MNKIIAIFGILILISCDWSRPLILRNKLGSDIELNVSTTKDISRFEYIPSVDSIVPYKELKGKINWDLFENRTIISVEDSMNYSLTMKNNTTVYLTPAPIGGPHFNYIVITTQFGIDTVWIRSTIKSTNLKYHQIDFKLLWLSNYVIDVYKKK